MFSLCTSKNVLLVVALGGLGLACSSGDSGGSPVVGGGAGGLGGGGDAGSKAQAGGGSVVICPGGNCGGGGGSLNAPAACGDSVLDADEACDDGNRVEEDGCSANCLVVASGYSCVVAGLPCSQIAKCGDNVLSDPELCDDGNVVAGDGCSPGCSLELGYKCEGSPSECTATVCGDGIIEGSESCDEGDVMPFDGCSTTCQREPDCSAGACESECGDFLIIDEECDDGNDRDGDGCSAACAEEPGFICMQSGFLGGTLQVPIIYRDFREHTDSHRGHPNFHHAGTSNATTGIAKVQADADGKPEYSGIGNFHVDSQENYRSWYRDSDFSVAYAETLSLTASGGKFTFDDTSFFPLDGRGWTLDATHPERLYADGHNFFFTSEVRYWVKYDPAANAALSFRGDDDVWVFVGGRLVIDLGGVHDAVPGSFTLNASTTDTAGVALDLEPGRVYEISVFQAERNPTGSNYKLELSDFNPAPSTCTPVCGDGILSLGEQCDDGSNAGGYGQCGAGCVLDLYCGDGVLTTPEEHCDDGNRVDADSCNNACRRLVVR